MSAWPYRFGYVVQSMRPKQAAAVRASELPLLLDTLDARYGKAVTERDRAAAALFQQLTCQFRDIGSAEPTGPTNLAKIRPSTFPSNGAYAGQRPDSATGSV